MTGHVDGPLASCCRAAARIITLHSRHCPDSIDRAYRVNMARAREADLVGETGRIRTPHLVLRTQARREENALCE